MRVAGVDYDTSGVHLVALPLMEHDGEDGWMASIAFRDKKVDAFEAIKKLPQVLMGTLEREKPGIEVAYIERGFGASRRSDFLLGRVQGAATVALDAMGIGVSEVQAGEWKKWLTGNGNADKELVKRAVQSWMGPVEFEVPDLYDAAGLALFARAESINKAGR